MAEQVLYFIELCIHEELFNDYCFKKTLIRIPLS